MDKFKKLHEIVERIKAKKAKESKDDNKRSIN